jgi:hypothetical protein
MTIELPADVHALRKEIARASLIRLFRQLSNEEPPDYLINSDREIRRAGQEWLEYYAHQVILLTNAAEQALSYPVDQQGFEAALGSFTSSVIAQPELKRLFENNPYLGGLIVHAIKDADLFRALLTLLCELGN